MVRRGFKTTVIATVIAMMLSPNFSALAQTGKSNTLGSWKLENNAWVFLDGEGKQVKGWVVYNQEWYYLNPENGQLKMGWLQLDGKWYFLSTEAGAMQGRLLTGWQWIDGYCYYFYGNDDSRYGELLVNGRTPDGYYVNQSGHWLQGEGGEAVYEAGRGLSSAASAQQVAGASRALPGQVLGASRAIAAPGGGSFGGGGGGGSTGGGGTTASVFGPAAATGNAGASTGAATGVSAAGIAGTADESATAGGATGASTGTEANANASTEAESNASVSTGETAGSANPSTEGTGANAGNEGTGSATGNEGTGVSTGTENPGAETSGNAGENPGAETGTEAPSTGGEGSETAPSTDNTAGTETGTENGGNAGENTGVETGGNAGENTGTETGTEAPSTGGEGSETAPSTDNTAGTETGTGNGGNAEGTPSGETGGNAGENSGAETEAPTQPETETPVTQPEKPVEDSHEEEVSLKDWPFEYRFEYDAEKKSFLLFFGENEDTKLVKEFLSRNVEVMVNDSHYELGDWTDDLRDAENKYIYALKWDIKERGYYNALRLARSAFHEGDNTVEFAPDGYKPLVFNFKVKRGMLQELKKLEKLQYHFEEKVLTGSYNVKIVKFEKLSAEQKACITGLKTLEVDGVSYTKVEDQRYEDLCADGRHAFMILNGTSDLAIGNPPKEYATHKISLHPEGYEDIEITYEKLENEPAPLRRKLEKKPGYYELSFQGSREDIQAYLTNIKKLTVAEREFGQMASFHTDLLSMGEKYTFGDSEGKKKVEDLLLFSVPTANVDKKQEIRIESEGYELNIIPLS